MAQMGTGTLFPGGTWRYWDDTPKTEKWGLCPVHSSDGYPHPCNLCPALSWNSMAVAAGDRDYSLPPLRIRCAPSTPPLAGHLQKLSKKSGLRDRRKLIKFYTDIAISKRTPDRSPLAGTQFSHLHPQGTEPLRLSPVLTGYSSKVLNTSTLSSGQGQPPAAWWGTTPPPRSFPSSAFSYTRECPGTCMHTHTLTHTQPHTHCDILFTWVWHQPSRCQTKGNEGRLSNGA